MKLGSLPVFTCYLPHDFVFCSVCIITMLSLFFLLTFKRVSSDLNSALIKYMWTVLEFIPTVCVCWYSSPLRHNLRTAVLVYWLPEAYVFRKDEGENSSSVVGSCILDTLGTGLACEINSEYQEFIGMLSLPIKDSRQGGKQTWVLCQKVFASFFWLSHAYDMRFQPFLFHCYWWIFAGLYYFCFYCSFGQEGENSVIWLHVAVHTWKVFSIDEIFHVQKGR